MIRLCCFVQRSTLNHLNQYKSALEREELVWFVFSGLFKFRTPLYHRQAASFARERERAHHYFTPLIKLYVWTYNLFDCQTGTRKPCKVTACFAEPVASHGLGALTLSTDRLQMHSYLFKSFVYHLLHSVSISLKSLQYLNCLTERKISSFGGPPISPQCKPTSGNNLKFQVLWQQFG